VTAGLQVWDASGNMVFDTNGRLFRKLGEVSYGTSNGSASFSRQSQDTTLVAVAKGWFPPAFSFNLGTNTISWDQSAVPSAYRNGGTVEIWAA